ncbi:ABC transporter substrate-binding protein [Cohaesibacter haloalkalitolerans]|uniref:ABC transporter substrate-binding protein n=1 Tax=Cohaesibacter haloalkalitolerans TaxID=1162980 RepID=UPI000E64C1FA|nr:sugar ABC transporter substrate-binding protein [Cohaesibacter haloalkalitolerans]
MKTLTHYLLVSAAVLAPTTVFAQDTVRYWMWDGQQAPVYQQCANDFEAMNSDIHIEITQTGWDQYWTNLTTSFISGDAPDVFVNHLMRLPEFAANQMIEDLTPLLAKASYDTSGYLPGLLENWSKDGAVYGLPKDWATVAVAYDRDKLKAAGLAPSDLADMTWNPENGGSFQKIIAHLTVDTNGKRGDEEGFDPNSVATFGLVLNPLSPQGETEWAYLAASTGWRFIDEPWSTHYNFDDPRLAKSLTWIRDLARVHHLMPTVEQTGRLGAETLMFSDKGAMTVTGSWLVGLYHQSKPSVAFAPIPAGPEGRKTMFNGLADSIWTGSPVKDAAWKWVQYLGSDACQATVAKAGVVFPAQQDQIETTVKAFEEKGVDVSAFTKVATSETTFAPPITDYGNEISSIVKAALEKVMLGQQKPEEILTNANEEVNSLF